jgi:hypothetical protein
MVAGVLSIEGTARSFASSLRKEFNWQWQDRAQKGDKMAGETKFFGSEVGGPDVGAPPVINFSYDNFPHRLFASDIYSFFQFARALPWILLPLRPCDSGDLAEMSFTRGNLFCIVVHFVLCLIQFLFVLSLPFMILFPVWMVAAGMTVFLTVNFLLCKLLNGKTIDYYSEDRYVEAGHEHADERWIFLNGVAVG